MHRNLSLSLLVSFLSGLPASLSLAQGEWTQGQTGFEGKKIRILGDSTSKNLAAGDHWEIEALHQLQNFNFRADLKLRWAEVHKPQHGTKLLSETNDFERKEGYFYFEGQKICGHSLTQVLFSKVDPSQNLSTPNPFAFKASSLLLGSMPLLGASAKVRGRFPKSEAKLRALGESFLFDLTGEKLDHFESVEDCIFQKDDMLYRAREVQARSAGMNYRIWLSDADVFYFEQSSFGAKIQAFVKNAKDNTLQTFDRKTKENGFLGNELFTINTHGVPKAFEPTNEFLYDPQDLRFKESSVFVHAQGAMDFYKKLGFELSASEMVKININVLVNGSKNNAMYEPPSLFDPDGPTISVGSGDGVVLQNLTTDSDVVSHELAHHMIYQTLKSTVGESLVLHEGLADFFAFAKSGDPCLGESICPETSQTCFLNTQCLRTAANDLTYNSSVYSSLSPHQQGQLVSGLLWDLSSKPSASLENLAQTAYRAVGFLNPRSDIQDFLTAFALADFTMNQGKSLCEFSEAAKLRGFESVLETAVCDDIKSWPKIDGAKSKKGGPGQGTSSSHETSSMDGVLGEGKIGDQSKGPEKKSERKLGFCAFVPEGPSTQVPSILLFLMLGLPFILGLSGISRRRFLSRRSCFQKLP
jgi:hypothetical protein